MLPRPTTPPPPQLLVATGDDFGKVKLFSYPCTAPQAPFRFTNAHSSHVTCVRFAVDGTHVIRCGLPRRNDAMVAWRLLLLLN
jgi:hypothetical protein